jgi:hypothetical protein
MCMYSQLHGNIYKNNMHLYNNSNIHVQLHGNTYNLAPTTLPPSNATVAPLT